MLSLAGICNLKPTDGLELKVFLVLRQSSRKGAAHPVTEQGSQPRSHKGRFSRKNLQELWSALEAAERILKLLALKRSMPGVECIGCCLLIESHSWGCSLRPVPADAHGALAVGMVPAGHSSQMLMMLLLLVLLSQGQGELMPRAWDAPGGFCCCRTLVAAHDDAVSGGDACKARTS